MSDSIVVLLDAAEAGKSIIENRVLFHFTYIPDILLHKNN